MKRRILGLPVVVVMGLVLCAAVSAANIWGAPDSPAAAHPAVEASLEPAVPLTSASLSISPGTIDLGQGIAIQTTPNGGTAPYTYEYFGLPGGCNVDEAQSFQCTPDQAGTFSVYVNITDANDNQTNSNTVGLTVDASLEASLSVSPSTITEGQSLEISTSASGGSGTYAYEYSGLPNGCQGYNSASFSCTPSSTGSYNVDVNVTDTNNGYVISNNQNVQINSANNGGSGSGGSGDQGSSSGNNSSNPFADLLSGFSGILSLVIIFGIVAFATWILLIVGVWVVAVVLIRRLPKNGATAAVAPLGKCSSCSAAIPGGTKYCPECGASQAPKAS